MCGRWETGNGRKYEFELGRRESGRAAVGDEEPFISGTANARREDEANSPFPAEDTNEAAGLNLSNAQSGAGSLNRPE